MNKTHLRVLIGVIVVVLASSFIFGISRVLADSPNVSFDVPINNGSNGYFRAASVAASFTATDDDTDTITTITCTDSVDGAAPVNLSGTTSGIGSITATISFSVSGDGVHAVSCTATNNNGQVNSLSTNIKIDNTAPAVTCGSSDGLWHSANVSVGCTATDSASGPASQNHDLTTSVVGGTEDANASTDTYAFYDNAGNSTTAGPLSGFKIDLKSPVVTCGSGDTDWHASNQTVSCTASDSGSGLKFPADASFDLTTSVALNAEDNNASTGTYAVLDAVNNSSTAGPVTGFHIDRKAPVVTCGTADANWHATDQSVNCTASDGGSGLLIAADASFTLSTSVAANTENSDAATGLYNVLDNVNNSATAGPVNGFMIDKKAPTASCEAADPAWFGTNQAVTCTAIDGGSGPASQTFDLNTSVVSGIETDAAYTDTHTFADDVGNTISTGTVGPWKIDRKAPQIVCDTPDAIWHTTNLTSVSCAATDGGSGMASASSATLATSIANGTETDTAYTNDYTFTDVVGNTATGSVGPYKIDMKAPVVTCAGSDGVWHAVNLTVSCSATDLGSGLNHAGDSSFTLSTNVAAGTEDNNASTGSYDVEDNVNHVTPAGPLSGFMIDRKAPVVTCDPSNSIWHADNVSVTCTATDGGSGPASQTATVSTSIADDAQSDDAYTGTSTFVDGVNNETLSTAVGPFKVDRKDPAIQSITPDRTRDNPASDPLDWYNHPVIFTVDYSNEHNGSTVTCPSITYGDGDDASEPDGMGLTVLGTCHDEVGNTGSDISDPFNYDDTNPTILGAPDRAANGSNWYNDNVTVTFTCSDNLSGVDTCSSAVPLSEGTGQTANGSVTDVAGNSASTTVSNINIDKTPPTISGTPDRAANANGWYSADVTVTFTCNDDRSGIASCTSPSTLGEGPGQSVPGTAIDLAGNRTDTTVSPINIDKTDPSISANLDKLPDISGWFNVSTGVPTVSFTCSDGPAVGASGISGTCPTSHTFGQGSALSYNRTVYDLAGNSATNGVSDLYVDTVAPVINGAVTPDRPASGWWNNSSGAPTVSYTCSDATSLVVSCPDAHTFGDGEDQTWTSTVFDNAGNSTDHTVIDIDVDLTALTIVASIDFGPSATGWYNSLSGAPTVSFVCDDGGGSGLNGSCPSPHLFSDGENQSYEETVYDNAGNSATDGVSDIDVDLTPPTITSAITPLRPVSGWWNFSSGAPTVSFVCSDATSGPQTCPTDHLFVEDEDQSWSYSGTDRAGNTAAGNITNIDVDLTPPSISSSLDISADPVTTWFNIATGAPTVSFTCSDLDPDGAGSAVQSGIAGSCPGPHLFGSDPVTQTYSQSVNDLAGNSASAQVSVKVDLSTPTITAAADRAPNASGWYMNDVIISFTCNDSYSGIAAGACPLAVTLGEGVDQSVTRSVTDIAGNPASTTLGGIDIDKTAPTIIPALDISQDPVTGWFNIATGAPTVSYTCTDPDPDGPGIAAPSGMVGACPGPHLFGELQDPQLYNQTIYDVAGNSATASVTVKVDLSAPDISATLNPPKTTTWYNATSGAPRVIFNCNDPISGIKTCPEMHLFGDSRNAQSWSGTAYDKAGNSATAGVTDVYVDVTPPGISAVLPSPHYNGWYNQTFSINFVGNDAASGVASCSPEDFAYSGPTGRNIVPAISGYCTDIAGNKSVTIQADPFNFDNTKPTTSTTISRGPDIRGWYNEPVTISFSGRDGFPGIEGCTSPITYSVTDSLTASVTGSCWDEAGNSTSATHTFQYDDSPPVLVTGAPDRLADKNGWFNHLVNIVFAGTDSPSGIYSCATVPYFNPDGTDLTVQGTCTDTAGNESGLANSVTFKYDSTRPLAVGSVPAPNSWGWYNAPVPVTFTGTDTLSGIDTCVANPATITLSGTNRDSVGMCYDKAGNISSTAIVSGINLDLVLPNITFMGLVPPADYSGWNYTPVTLAWACADPLSGVVFTPVTVTINTSGTNMVAHGTCEDKAGNTKADTQRNININLNGQQNISLIPTSTSEGISPTATSSADGSNATGGNNPTSTNTPGSDQGGNGADTSPADENGTDQPGDNDDDNTGILPYLLGGLFGTGLIGASIFFILKRRKKSSSAS